MWQDLPRRVSASGPKRYKQGCMAHAPGNGPDGNPGRNPYPDSLAILPRRGFAVRCCRALAAVARLATLNERKDNNDVNGALVHYSRLLGFRELGQRGNPFRG